MIKAELMHAVPYTTADLSTGRSDFKGVHGARLMADDGNTIVALALQFFVTHPIERRELWLRTQVSLLSGKPLMEDITLLALPDRVKIFRYTEGEIWGFLHNLSIPARSAGFYRLDFFLGESRNAAFQYCHGSTLVNISPDEFHIEAT